MAVVTGVLAVSLGGPATAWGQAGGQAESAAGAPSLSMPEPVSLRDRNDTATVRVPVPRGITPTTYRATVHLPLFMDTGEIEVSNDDTVLRRIDLSQKDEGTAIEVPLDRAKSVDGYIVLTFRTVLRAAADECRDWSAEKLELTDARVAYEGTPTRPQTIADFTTPYLEKLEIYLPDAPSTAEAQAAARIATTEVSRFGAGNVTISVLPESAPKPEPSTPFIRRAVIREDPEKKVRITDDAVPTMEVTGSGDELSQQVDLIQSNLWNVVVGDEATIDSPAAGAVAPMDDATLDALRVGTVSATGVGSVGVDVGVDLTAMSRDASDLTVDLVGTYSPVPADQGAMFTARVGETIVDSWPAEPSGTLERTVRIPAADVSRYTDLSLSLQVSGSGVACGETLPIALTVNGASRVTPGGPSRPATRGFQSLPQVLMPNLVVATTYDTLAATRRAIRLLADLQGVSATALRPRWTTLDEARSSSDPALVINSRENPTGFGLPLELTGGRSLELLGGPGAQNRTVHFDSDFDFAAVQVAEHDGRPLLVASSSSGESELDRTLDWIEAEPDRFGALSGNVLFTAEGRPPVELSTAEGAAADASEVAESGAGRVLVIASVVTAAGLVLAALLWFVARPRRRGTTPGS